MSSYLDQAGTQYLWGKVKTWVGNQGYLKTHQTVTDASPTLSWGATSKVATIGNTDIHVTMPSNPNTDTKVTQTKTTVSGVKYLIFSNSTDTNTDGVSKDSRFYLNNSPSLIVQDSSNRQASLTPGVGIDINNGNSVGTRLQHDDVVMYGSGNTWDGSHSSLKNALAGKSNTGHTHSYLPLSGGTLTGALNTANNTWNKIGDDVQIGDRNIAGGLGIQGLNGNTNITFYKYGDASKYASLRYDGTNFIFNKNLYCENYAVHQKRTAVTMGTSSNNGCTSYQEMNYYNVDTNDYWMTRMCTALETNGNVALHMQCRNTKTDGNVVQNNLALGVKKDGSRYVTLTDAGAWRSALGAAASNHNHTGTYARIASQAWGKSISFTPSGNSAFIVIMNSNVYVGFWNGNSSSWHFAVRQIVNSNIYRASDGTGTRSITFSASEISQNFSITFSKTDAGAVTVSVGSSATLLAFYR